MQSKLNPYISFNGTAREAMEFYKGVFGGKLTMSTFKEAGQTMPEGKEGNIMHAQLDADNGMTLMGSDAMGADQSAVSISISLSGDNEAELKGYWDKLTEGGKITQPLVAAPWGDQFGMVNDKFGIHWMVNIAAKKA